MIDLKGKGVLILGFGAEGRANLEFARRQGAKEIAVADQVVDLSLEPAESAAVSKIYPGSEWLSQLHTYDVILRSPGVPLRHLEIIRRDHPEIAITSGTDIFLNAHGAKTIGITGTKGKSTTSSLIYSILSAAGYNAKFGGNIGLAAVNLLEQPADIYVLELSSYQLADISNSPSTSLFLNLFPEHLDHHGNFESYGLAKANISRFQKAGDRLVLPHDFAVIDSLTHSHLGDRITWGEPRGSAWLEDNAYFYRDPSGITHRVCHANDTILEGPGNKRNIQAVLAALSHLMIAPDVLARVITTFKPLPHRLENVGTIKGITFINDSISTVPEAAINALETFGRQVKTVILGGYDRGVSFNTLATYLIASTEVTTVILFPPSGSRIAQTLREHPDFQSRGIKILSVETMCDAISLAYKETPVGAVCLLSPASPSFPIFKNFEERGAIFRNEVLRISERQEEAPID
jgi:UDP-N-acetylmuramoylalanine--D-glutamate ligase